MRLTAAPRSNLSRNVPLVALLVHEGKPPGFPCGELGARARTLMGRKVFGGERRQTLLLHNEARAGPRALLLIGMGKQGQQDAEEHRRAGALAVHQAATLKASKLVLGWAEEASPGAAELQALGEGAVLAGYRYPDKKASTQPPAEVSLASGARGAARVLRVARVLADAANLARELGDLPGNRCTPRYLAQRAKATCQKAGLRCRIYDKKALQRMKMGGILGVNQGSAQPPFLVEMDYRPAKARHTLCVVGKGLTMDTGGISIKPSARMEEMKYDMCGAAAVVGLMDAVGRLKPAGLRVVGIVGTTENMPGPAAYKPGDVVRTGSGKTIEVINTDAEGRVVLADALHHATGFEPDAIVDLATLTGAIVIALGTEAGGLFCDDDELAGRLLASAGRTGEKLWRMPTYEAHKKQIESQWADVKNSAGREASSCTAAQFLFSFTEGQRHAHIDMAGMANDGRKRDYHQTGASGWGVRLLYDLVDSWKR